jgi:hypothetical protein
MAVDFLTTEQKSQYGQFLGCPTDIELALYFCLDDVDRALIDTRRGHQNKLGFALQLLSVRFLGGFPANLTLIPSNVQVFVAQQLLINDVTVLANYSKRETTDREHTALIRKHYGYEEFNNTYWGFRLSRLLYSRAWLSDERPILLFDFATAWLIQHKVLLPGVSTLSRLIVEIRQRAAQRLWQRLSVLPTIEQKEKLETLLNIPDGMRTSIFDYYQKEPTTISSLAFNATVERYLELQAFGMTSLNFSRIPPVRLKNLARYAAMISVSKIARLPENRRIAMLIAFVTSVEIRTLDDALDIFDLLITGISRDAKRIGQKKRLRTLKDLDKSALALADICSLFLVENLDSESLLKTIFQRISKEKLTTSISVINELARSNDEQFYREAIAQYGRVQRFLPICLRILCSKSSPF